MQRGVAFLTVIALMALAGSVIPNAAAAAGSPGDVQPGRTVSILGVGDILTHRQIIEQARRDARGGDIINFVPQLKGVAAVVKSADLAICHMEYPMGSKRGPWTAWPGVADAPPALATAVAKIGFDGCSTASNHSLDQGFPGVERLLNALDANGLAHSGTARTKEEASNPTIVDVKGVPVGMLSYTYSFNGIPRPYDKSWCANLISTAKILDEARQARKRGARIVVLSLHAGNEEVIEPSAQQREVVRLVAESGLVDLVLGHHVHRVQPVERIKGMWVAYGHGNLLTAQSRKDPRSGDGLISRFTFTESADGSFVATEAVGFVVHNDDYPYRLRVVGPKMDRDGALAGSWARTKAIVYREGAREQGFRLLPWSG